MVTKKGDVVWEYHGVGFFSGLLHRMIHKKGAKIVSELCEYPGLSSAVDNARYRRIGERCLKKDFPRYDGIVAISDELMIVAKKYAKHSCKIIKIPILVDFCKYAMEDLSHEAKVPYIFHAGKLTENKDGILGMLEAFGKACLEINEPFQFKLTGNMESSIHRKEIESIISQYSLSDRVEFLGYLSSSDLKYYLSRAEIVIINKYHSDQNKYCFSTKLGEYLAASKVVITTDVGESNNWLENEKNAIVIKSDNVQILANTILNLHRDKKMRKSISNNARNLSYQAFDYHAYSSTLSTYLSLL